MAKSTAWLVTIIGLWLVLAKLGVLGSLVQYQDWIIALLVLAIGIGKLVRNYKERK